MWSLIPFFTKKNLRKMADATSGAENVPERKELIKGIGHFKKTREPTSRGSQWQRGQIEYQKK